MAKPDVNKVTLGAAPATGAIFVAPVGTALPTDATTALPDAYKCMGYTSSDGLTISYDTDTGDDITAWEGQTVVAAGATTGTENWAFQPLETNAEVARATWGEENVKYDESKGTLELTKAIGATMPVIPMVIEEVPRAGMVRRSCAQVQRTELDDETHNGTEGDQPQLTFKVIGYSHVYVAFSNSTADTAESGNA